MITVTVNGASFEFKQKLSVAQALAEMKVSREHGLAIALNYKVLPGHLLESTLLENEDKLEIIHATAGG